MARNSWYIVQAGAMRANCLVGFHRIFGDIAPGFDWFFRWIRQFEGDTPY